MGGRDGRAGDASPGGASPAAGAWTRTVTSARPDRLHQVDGAAVRGRPGRGRALLPRAGRQGHVAGGAAALARARAREVARPDGPEP